MRAPTCARTHRSPARLGRFHGAGSSMRGARSPVRRRTGEGPGGPRCPTSLACSGRAGGPGTLENDRLRRGVRAAQPGEVLSRSSRMSLPAAVGRVDRARTRCPRLLLDGVAGDRIHRSPASACSLSTVPGRACEVPGPSSGDDRRGTGRTKVPTSLSGRQVGLGHPGECRLGYESTCRDREGDQVDPVLTAGRIEWVGNDDADPR